MDIWIGKAAIRINIYFEVIVYSLLCMVPVQPVVKVLKKIMSDRIIVSRL